jgi:UDP-2,3-diacylglucosamine hydrolase
VLTCATSLKDILKEECTLHFVKQNTYFISDLHLGAPSLEQSQQRERKVVDFLKSIEDDCATLYIVGDLFDYWFEYKRVVPRGHTRLLGTLANMADKGMNLHVFTGNHDLWMTDYLEEELGATVHHQPSRIQLGTGQFYIAHGDGLGPGDLKYKMIKRIFTNPVCQWLYRRLHPNFGIGFAARMSRASRNSQSDDDHAFLGDKERQLQHSLSVLENENIDFFIYGHRHHLKDLPITRKRKDGTKIDSRYVVLGDWISLDSFAKWDGTTLTTSTYSPKQ